MSKTLVAYFSASGRTRKQAEKIAKEQNADLYEIKPVVPYTKADLNWWNEDCRSIKEMKDPAYRRPEIIDDDAHIEDYDVIYLGFPIWCYIAPTIVNTFLEKYDFSGKKIILFATSGGSRWGKTVDSLKGSVAADCVIETSTVNGR